MSRADVSVVVINVDQAAVNTQASPRLEMFSRDDDGVKYYILLYRVCEIS